MSISVSSDRADSHRPWGVSVAICCHDSGHRLPATLAYLKNQHARDVEWEVLVIDNASTDHSTEVARQVWLPPAPAPMRIIPEQRLGLSYARECAMHEARYELVSFVDDDNHVAADWVSVASEIMSADQELGALGSVNCAKSSVAFPNWFPRYCQYYAAADHYGSSTMPSFMLNGAGMTLRYEAWRDLERNGFRSQLSDRIGARLSSCGDIEWGLALALAGWKVRIEPRLRLQHCLSADRLNWPYLRKLLRAIGEAQPVLDAYYYAAQYGSGGKDRLRQYWWWHFIAVAAKLLREHSPWAIVHAYFSDMEGNDNAAEIELRVGRLRGFAGLRSRYRIIRREIAQAPWRRRDSVFGSRSPHVLTSASLYRSHLQ